MLNIVLHEPEMPANTGNIGRTCVITGTALHLIEPLGFRITDKMIRRSGLDYWPRLNVTSYRDIWDFYFRNGFGGDYDPDIPDSVSAWLDEEEREEGRRPSEKMLRESSPAPHIYYATTKGQHRYTDVTYHDGDYIVFGKESAGIPEEILVKHPEDCIRIPMKEGERSLNLSNSVSIVLYEALRQLDFPNLETEGHLHRLRLW